MFGYVVPDKPNMYIKDFTLFRAYYCGLCHATKKECGQVARFAVNYDVAFISALFHDWLSVPVNVVRKSCVLNARKKAVIDDTPLMRRMVRFNNILVGMKLVDDATDKGGKHIFRKLAFKRKVKKARKAEPILASIADKCVAETLAVEKTNAGVDAAAEPFANMMKEVFKHFSGEKQSEQLNKIGYFLGKYVYIMDALDDYDEDIKKGDFNPFVQVFKNKDYKSFISEHEQDVRFIIESIVRSIEEEYKAIDMSGSEGVVTNVLWYGLRARANAVINKKGKKCVNIRL